MAFVHFDLFSWKWNDESMRKGFITTLLVGLVASIAILVGTIYVKQTQKPSTPQEQQLTQPPTDETDYTDESTANWKTYENKVYKFSLEYPFGYSSLISIPSK